MPSRSATSFAGGGASLRPRPRGASGRVSRYAISCSRREALEDVGAERSRRGDGEAHHYRRTGCGRRIAERLLAVLVVGAVDDQHAVEMVELVLDDARAHPLELEAARRPRRDPCPRA